MNTVQRIFKNTGAMYVGQIFVMVSGFILAVLVARELGPIEFGKFSTALAYTLIFGYLLDLGYTTVLIREVSRDKSLARKYFGNVLTMRLIVGIVGYGILVLITNLMSGVLGTDADTRFVIYFLGIYTGSMLLGDISRGIFRAYEKMEYDMLTVIIREGLRSGLGIAVLLFGYGLRELAVVLVIPGIIDLGLSVILCRLKFVKPRIELDWLFWKQTIWIAFPITMQLVFGYIMARTDTVMLNAMKGSDTVGWYNAAYTFCFAIRPFPQWFMQALLPLASMYYVSSLNMLKILYEKSCKILLIIGLPVAVGLSVLAERLVLLVYDLEYEESIIALQILAWNLFFGFIGTALAQMMVVMNLQTKMAIAMGAGAVLNVVVNAILIPPYSYTGAAIATVVTSTIIIGVLYYIVSKNLMWLPLHKMLPSPIISSAVMAGFLYIGRDLSLVVLIGGGALVYFAVLFVTRGVSADDMEMVKQLRNRPKSGALAQESDS